MVTIKDIAKLAGVAQGTVSNVLNDKGNVSSEKIKRVLDAAHALGYVPNEKAALLRKGYSDSLVVIMPDSRARQYDDFYLSFKSYASDHGYKTTRFLINENTPGSEEDALSEIRPLQAKGIACVSAVAGTSNESAIYQKNSHYDELPHMVFIDRKPGFPADFIGFDYREAGRQMAGKALAQHLSHVCLLTANLEYSNESDFYHGFMDIMNPSACRVTHIQTDPFRRYQHIMQVFNGPMPQAFFISNYAFAENVKDLCTTFYQSDHLPRIYTVSPVFTLPENVFTKYEMNYRQLGKIAAEYLIRRQAAASKEEPSCQILKSDGFRNWYSNILVSGRRKTLNVITLDSPEAHIMRSFSKLYTQKSNVDVNICIYSYDEIYEAYNSLSASRHFDVLRLDVTWLSWFAEKLLMPLTDIDPDIENLLDSFIEGTPQYYARVHGQIYTLPATPSVQLLYYRKDLFESPIYKRMYYEQFRTELVPPKTFEEFNRIASFFTRSINPLSPVEYGTTITMGSTGVAGSEYLSRLFSYQANLYDSNLEIHLDSDTALRALKDLIEIRKYTAANYCNWWINTARNFADGGFAMAPLYSNYASDLLSHSSNIIGKIGFTMMPGANPIIGGGSLGISKHSAHPEDALSFIRWICSEPISSAAALLGSISPCRKTYENYEVMHNFPWMSLCKKCFPLVQGRRIPDHIGTPFDERKFLGILGMAVKNAYSSVITPEEALKNAQEMMEQNFQCKYV
ncbi:MAG: extracellular solute-binding protein [Lachnospiraceae bacterium]|nr:extracellular solute-binding protein [Lachnospiraceae bacterium]